MIKLAKNKLASYLRTVLLTHLEKNHQSIALVQCDTTERLVAHLNDRVVCSHSGGFHSVVMLSTNEDPNLLTQVPLAS